MRTKQRIILVVALAAVLGIALFTGWSWMKDPDPAQPMALVNGVPITFKELQREMKKTRDNYAMQNVFPDKAELKQLKNEILERLIETELLWQQAQHKGMVVSDEAVTAELETMKKQYGNAAILNNMLKNRKMSQEEFLGLIRKDLTIQSFVEQEIAAAITVSDTACENYYRNNLKKFEVPENVRASHLCIFVHEDAPDAEQHKAEAAIQSLEQRLKNGEVFEDLAREASQCASSERGGDLGFISRGSMDPKFEKAAFALKLNELSPIVRSSMGYHIIKVTDRAPARVMSFEEVKENIAQQLKDQKIESGVKAHLAELLKQADVKRMR